MDPEHFGVFDKAFITLFYVTGGDPWPESLPKAGPSPRDTNLYVCRVRCEPTPIYMYAGFDVNPRISSAVCFVPPRG